VKKPQGDNARLIALELIADVLEHGRNLSDSIHGHGADARSRAHAAHLAYGVLRWLNALEWLAGQLLQRPMKKKDRDIQRLVLLGIFQLWKDGTPPHAAINETAGCARLLGKSWAVGLVNAVLRRFQREQEGLLSGLQNEPQRFAHPGWLLEALQTDWPGQWEAILRANNCQPPMWLRMNPRYDLPASIAALEQDGLQVSPHPAAANARKIDPPRPVSAIPGFREGRLSVQDAAAQLAADLLEADDGQRILDACAAPGGKTGHLLEMVEDAELVALDRSKTRLQRVQENLDRLGFSTRATLITGDAAQPDDWWDGNYFDRILLDAPCSATGVIRRHPEIKWLRDPGQVQEAVMMQASLLRALWPLLAPGGILVYATCSILHAENVAQVAGFLADTTDAEHLPLEAEWGREVDFGRQILPGDQDMDGFYYARLRKNGQE
jgi:16S rRNA (cytosine967-C5)-methyltransferase